MGGLAALADLVAAGRLTPHVQSVYDLDAVGDVVSEASAGKVAGKVVLRVVGAAAGHTPGLGADQFYDRPAAAVRAPANERCEGTGFVTRSRRSAPPWTRRRSPWPTAR